MSFGVRRYERLSMLVVTRDGHTFHGSLKRYHARRGLVLSGVSTVDDRGKVAPAAGDVFVPIENLSHWQTAPASLVGGG